MLNTLLRKSKVVLQLSHKEGFEIKVTEALMKGKPVIAYRAGGIPFQIKNGEDGFLTEAGDTEAVSEHLYELVTQENKYKQMSENSVKLANKDYLTVANVISWLYLSNILNKNKKINGNLQWVLEMCRNS